MASSSDPLGLVPRVRELSGDGTELMPQRANAIRGQIRRVLSDDVVTKEEEEQLVELARQIGVDDKAWGSYLRDEMEDLAIAQLNQGELDPIEPERMLTVRGEEVYGEFPASLLKEVVKREVRGGYGGISIPVGFGVRVHTGGGRGRSVETGRELVTEDRGTLCVTDRRTVFVGHEKTLEMRHNKLVHLEAFEDALRVNLANRQSALLFKVPAGGRYIAAVVNAAFQRTQ